MSIIAINENKRNMLKKWVFPITASIITGTAFSLFISISTTNIFSLIFLFLLYPIYKKSFEITDKRIKRVSYICGVLYAGAFVLFKLSDLMAIESYLSTFYFTFNYIVGFFLFFSSITAVIYNKLNDTSFISNKSPQKNLTFLKKAIFFILCMVIILVSWMPYFLRNFPGDITNDSRHELMQAVGTEAYSERHPIVHTMMIKLFYNFGMILFDGDQTMAVATYSACQAILLAAALSYLLVTFYKFNVKKPVIIGSLAFYSLIPYHGVYSITMWKDVWFGGIVLVISTTIWRLVRHYREGVKKLPVFEFIMLFIFGIAMCLFRGNGFYAYIILVPFVFLAFFRKNFIPIIISTAVLPIAFIIKGPIYNLLNIAPTDTIESLSIPAQHIAGALCDGAGLTKDEYELLSQVLDVERIVEVYNPTISDPVKGLVWEKDNQEFIDENKGKFLKLWIDVGLRNPISYIVAHINQTYGYWYPDVQYWVYSGEFLGADEGYELRREMKLSESANEFYTYFLDSYKDVHYWGLFWSIGTASWLCIFMFGLCFLKRRKSYLLVYIPVFSVLATLMIATPVYSEFRYAYSVFTTLPLLCVVPFCRSSKNSVAVSETVNTEEILSDVKDHDTDSKSLEIPESDNASEAVEVDDEESTNKNIADEKETESDSSSDEI